ncbi:MAG: DEAD/DEAH box helicase, partial [Planctomycetota bacterium]|nr:DEAD/DEAH box helicase [Planctomycetota bacterium]
MPDKTRRRSAGGQSRPRRSGGANRSASRAPKKRTTNSNIQPLTPVLEPPDIESFAEFALGDETQGAIAAMGITKPTPIQALAIEPVLRGKDVIAKAETGTGKTLAFGAPMMAKIDPTRSTVLGLVLSPTRELAEQVHDVLEKLGEARGVKTALVVGGEDMGAQIRKIQAGAQVIVGTPGRVLDLLNQKFLQVPWTEFAILDEADKMLEIGFIDDVKKILDAA